jgi:alpha-galactosidase
MIKITLLGAGSFFAQPLFTDILNIEGLDKGTIGLVDIDKRRLELSVKVLSKTIDLLGKKGWKIEASSERKKILKGSDYLINTIEVSGTQCVRYDNDIPLKYGIDQCIGDTVGPGGVMKALRTVPVYLDILKDVQKYCPQALILNYTNPMSILMLAASRQYSQPMLGLCHSVQFTSKNLAGYINIPHEDLAFRCGGVNHIAWFTELSYKGKNAYPMLFEAMKKKDVYEKDPVRFDIMKNFGFFVTESSGHFSEYVPYYRKRKDLIKKFCRDKYLGQSSFYADCWPKWRKDNDDIREQMISGKKQINTARSHEFAADIIEAHQFNRLKTVHATVPNTNLIPNLPLDGVVEVPVLIDKNGFTPTYFGNLPQQLAAISRSNMAVYELCVQGILNNDKESIIHAMILDPLSAAVCSPGEIRNMAQELFKAEKDFIPNWCNSK